LQTKAFQTSAQTCVAVVVAAAGGPVTMRARLDAWLSH